MVQRRIDSFRGAAEKRRRKNEEADAIIYYCRSKIYS